MSALIINDTVIECGSAFKANSALSDHRKRVHLKLKPHQCQYCPKDFFSKKDLGEHVRYKDRYNHGKYFSLISNFRV